jgi:putative DNA-invertase from lambdoid prophage Rac
MTGGPRTPPGGRGSKTLPPGDWAAGTDRVSGDLTRGRAVTYHRVSTVDQNPELARDELELFAQVRRLEVVARFEETASGARSDRPELLRMLELVRKHKVTHVLVWKLDRLSRSTMDLLALLEQLERHGVTFIATSQSLEVGPGSGPTGRLTMQVLAAVAEFERQIISERTLLGLAGARARGRKLGRPLGSKDQKPRRRRR